MVCVGGVGTVSGRATALSDTWLFELRITSIDSSLSAHGTWTLLSTEHNPLGPRHSSVMVNSPRQSSTAADSNLEGFILFGGSSVTACMEASHPELPQSQWAQQDVWMLVISGLGEHAGSVTAAWLRLFPMNPLVDSHRLQETSLSGRSAAAGAMVNDTLVIYGGHTAALTPSAEMPALILRLHGPQCLAPSNALQPVANDCLIGASRMNVTLQIKRTELDIPQLQTSKATGLQHCDIRAHLQEESGAMLTESVVHHQRCAARKSASSHHSCMSRMWLFTG
jgi:hypothetical protein